MFSEACLVLSKWQHFNTQHVARALRARRDVHYHRSPARSHAGQWPHNFGAAHCVFSDARPPATCACRACDGAPWRAVDATPAHAVRVVSVLFAFLHMIWSLRWRTSVHYHKSQWVRRRTAIRTTRESEVTRQHRNTNNTSSNTASLFPLFAFIIADTLKTFDLRHGSWSRHEARTTMTNLGSHCPRIPREYAPT